MFAQALQFGTPVMTLDIYIVFMIVLKQAAYNIIQEKNAFQYVHVFIRI